MADLKEPTSQTPPAAPQGLHAQYARMIRQLVLPPLMGAVLGSVLYIIVAAQQGAWQVAMGAAGLSIAAALAVLAYRLAKQGREAAVGWLLMGAIAIAYGLPELFWSGVTLYLAIGGSLLIILAATVAVRHHLLSRTAGAVVLYVAYMALANIVRPFSRFDISQITSVFVFLIGITIVLALAILVQLLRAFRIGTIRTRLLIAFVSLVLLPVAATGGISSVIGATTTRQRTADSLSALGALKVAEVRAWLSGLQTDLQIEIARDAELRRLTTLLTQPVDSADYQTAVQGQRTRFQGTVDLEKSFEELMLLDLNGQVVLSTEAAQVGKNFAAETWFKAALAGPHVNPPLYAQSLDRFVVYAGNPVRDTAERVIGVVAGRANLTRLDAIMAERAGLGETGETYVMGTNFAVLTALRYPYNSRYMRTTGPLEAIATESTGSRIYPDYRGVSVIGAFQWIPELRVALIAEQDSAEAFQSSTTTLTVTGIATVLILVLAVVAALFLTNSIAAPIGRLAKVAEQIATGDLTVAARVERNDEMGALARSFNVMTEQLRSFIGSLEDRVTARTEDLRASADVGRAVASTLHTDELLSLIVNLIVERFGLYYAAVFTLDETGQYAVLREANGEAGRTLKERRHQLEVGGQSMVGYVTARRTARIALDVGADAMRFANPLLPDTRSEIALPLIVGDRVLGALDVQSTQAAAFDEASAAVLQSMADQIAVALSNAEQFAETRNALHQAEVLSKSIQALISANSIQAICQLLAEYANSLVGADHTYAFIVDHERRQILEHNASGNVIDHGDHTYESLNSGISGMVFRSGRAVLSLHADDGIEPAETRERRKQFGAGALIVAPLIAQEQVIGTVTVGNQIGQRLFTSSDVNLLTTLAAQAVNAIEKLQLFEQAQRAVNELDAVNRRLTGEIWTDFTRRTASNVRWVGTSDRAQNPDLPEVDKALDTGQIAVRALYGGDRLSIAVPIKLRDV
nr:GAF domain-containing protein [Thermoflexales bacterium]